MTERILIVDDNPLNTKLMRALLEVSGFAVEVAAHATEARAAVARQVPDIIVMDLQMPDVDGYTLTRELRCNESLKRVPIVAVTASAMRGDEQRAIDAGCNGYISKPVDTRRFVQTLRTFLSPAQSDSPQAVTGGR